MILCWFIQRVLGTASPRNGSISPRINTHVASCARCRRFQANQNHVIQRLQNEAEVERPPAPAFLHGKIMSQIAKASIEPPRVQHLSRPSWAVAGTIALACFLGILYDWNGKYFSKIDRSVETLARAASQEPPPQAFLPIPPSLAKAPSLHKWTGDLEQPLENELHAVVSDAHNAVLNLAQSFLPNPIEH